MIEGAQLTRENPTDAQSSATNARDSVASDPVQFGFADEAVMLNEPFGRRAEALRALRTHIMAQHVDAGRRALAICSASEGVGSSFVAVNLAMALAQVGTSVLLIDGDMRSPQVQDIVRPSRKVVGLQQCLVQPDPTVGNYIYPDVIENLSIMYAGGVAPDAQELLASERFGLVVDRCMRDYDLTIIDTPPANRCADGRRISTVAGYSLIVAKRHTTFVSDIAVLGQQLTQERARIVGTVLNEA